MLGVRFIRPIYLIFIGVRASLWWKFTLDGKKKLIRDIEFFIDGFNLDS